MDNFKIDSHKLIYQIPRVYQWLQGKKIYPIYIEIGLHGSCNHRCIFCALDFLKYKPDVLDEGCLKRLISEAAQKGVKAILYSGEGEPLLHRSAIDIIIFTKQKGIAVALVTNGVLFDKDKAERALEHLTWIKVSLDAGTKKTYSMVHGARKEDFNMVINNLRSAVKIRDKHKYSCTIGAQLLLMPENYREITTLAKLLSQLGVDYLVIKPYCQHPSSSKRIDSKFKYKDLFYLEEILKKYCKDNFQIIFRRNAMEKANEKKPYKYCLGLPFATHITAKGDVYPCNAFVGKKNFIFGNICRENFITVWGGKRRKKIMDFIYNHWDIKNCRDICRLDEINRYLWELKNPSSHVNFI